jgi:hypothetical protein
MNAVPPYEPSAVVPAETFQPVDAVLLERSQAVALERLRPAISLLSLTDAVTPILGTGHFADDATDAEARAKALPLDALMTAVTTAMRINFVWSAARFEWIGLAHAAPGQCTTTINRANGHRLGLHVDSWDRLPMSERGASRYRASVNLGISDRYFLFVAMTAGEALQIAEQAGVVPQNATAIFRMALSARPQTKVFRLRVPPGWAYVAPTDNLAHDGSTLGGTSYDFSLHGLADFRPLKHFFDTSMFVDLRREAVD